MWRIEWRNKITGFLSRGEAVFTTEKAARKMTDVMNRKYPYIEHWVVKV